MQPTVIRATLGMRTGYLVSYNEFAAALKIPNTHWLMEINDIGNYLEILLRSKKAMTCKNGILHKHETPDAYIVRTKQQFMEVIGAPVERIAVHFYLRIAPDEFRWVCEFPTAYLLMCPKQVYIWIDELDKEEFEPSSVIFVPDHAYLKRKY